MSQRLRAPTMWAIRRTPFHPKAVLVFHKNAGVSAPQLCHKHSFCPGQGVRPLEARVNIHVALVPYGWRLDLPSHPRLRHIQCHRGYRASSLSYRGLSGCGRRWLLTFTYCRTNSLSFYPCCMSFFIVPESCACRRCWTPFTQ